MMKRCWIRNLFTRPATRTIRKAPHRFRPALETLEERWVPSTFTVNSTADTGAGSGLFGDLRYCINQANSAGGAETIVFAPTVFATPQTINLALGQLKLSDTTGTETITGPAAGVTVSGNNASRVFLVDASVTASISGLTISGGNTTGSGGGVNNAGSLTLTNCTVSGNTVSSNSFNGYDGYGGGVFNNSGSLALTNCTVSGNSASNGGGGVSAGSYGVVGGTTTLTNCTVNGNSAAWAGGLYTGKNDTATLTNCTVSGNSATHFGGGGLNSYFGTITLGNTIVAGNTAVAYYGTDVATFGVFISQGNNLIGDTAGTSGWLSSDLTGTSAQPLNAVLAPLGNYGGPTQTMALLPGSPAIDAGSNALIPAGVTTDQRGLPRIVNGIVDIGAFESEGFNFTVVPGGTPQTATIGTPFANPLAVNVTANNPVEPVNGGFVTFVANPAANGASAFFSTPSAVIASGQAGTIAGPNNVDGSYTVVAASTGFSTTFHLTNTGPVFAHLIVNTTSPSLFPGAGLLSLPEAIHFADLDRSGNSNITFSSTVFATPRTITLTADQLQLSNTSESETITGPAAGVTVSGGGLSRVFQVDALVTASISGLTITGGTTAGDGGGLYNLGTATLNNCTVSGNTATASLASAGGGLSNDGTLTLTNCTVSGNTATTSLASAGGGLSNGGTLTMTNCTLSGNSATEGSSPYVSGPAGGGLYNGGTLTMTNCTVSGNSATGQIDCGGVANGSPNNPGPTLTMTNCTVTANSGYLHGGLYAPGSATLTNTIVAGGERGIDGDIYAGSLSGTNNLIGTGYAGGLANGVNGNLVGVTNPVLAPLGNYGGPTQTVALLPGSPAINAGTSGPGIPTTDQRGLGRVGAVDIGAFESQGFNFTVVPGDSPQTANIGTPFANPLAVKVTANNPVEPVNGGVVAMVAHPAANGATAILSASPAVIARGQAAVTAEPNNVDGSYTVVATSTGFSTTFDLTNAGPVYTSLVVNTTSGSLVPGAGLLSLPEAIAFNDTAPSANIGITFDKNVFKKAQTITLTGAQLELSNTNGPATITGPAAGVTVSGGGLSRVFQVDGLVTASISGLTITGGKTAGNGAGVVPGNGAGVQNYGALTLSNCRVNGNSVNAPYPLFSDGRAGISGGGLYNGGTLTMTNCTVSGNSAPIGGGVANGLVSNQGQMLTMSNCTVSDNSESNPALGGGGVRNAGTATLSNCTLSGNTGSYGGGLYNFGVAGASVTLANCTVCGNSAKGGGGVFNYSGSTMTLTNCSLTDNSATGGQTNPIYVSPYFGGGGVENAFATITLTNCTVSGNSSNNSGGGVPSGGGGVKNTGTATLSNCTVSGNSTNGNGGGLSNLVFFSLAATMTLSNCTVNDNSAVAGGGLFNQGTLNVASSNIDNNRATSAGGGISTTVGSATIADSNLNGNQVNSSGIALGGGIDCENSTLSLTNCTLSFNQANGGAGASGVAGGDAFGGGLDVALGSIATVKNTTFLGDSAQGGTGGSGANGGGGYGGGIAVTDTSSLSLSGGALLGNVAQGGAGGSGADGGNGEGGGVFVGAGATATINQAFLSFNVAQGGNGLSGGYGEGGGAYVASKASLAVTDSVFLLNVAQGGDGKHGGSNGEGIGGGVFTLGTFTHDPATVILFNFASTSGDNIGS